MIEILIVLLVLGAATVVFYPVLAGTGPVRAPRKLVSPLEPGVAGDEHAERRAMLGERKTRLLRSLSELDAELAAGRLAEADYLELKQRDELETARVMRELEALDIPTKPLKSGRKTGAKPEEAPSVPARRRIGTTLAWVGGSVAFATILGITMSKAVAPREAGGTMTGTIPGAPGPAPSEGGGSPMLPKANPARLAELEKVIQRDSSNVKALLEAGHLYLAERRLDPAARVTMRALRLDPSAAEAHAHVALLFMAEAGSQESPDSARMAINGAVSEIDRAIQLQPGLPEAWLFKGMVLMAGMQDQQGAAKAWEQYLKVAPPGADTMRIHEMVAAVKRAGAR